VFLVEAQINKYYWPVRGGEPRQLAKCQATCGRRHGPISERSRMQLPEQLQLQVGSWQRLSPAAHARLISCGGDGRGITISLPRYGQSGSPIHCPLSTRIRCFSSPHQRLA